MDQSTAPTQQSTSVLHEKQNSVRGISNLADALFTKGLIDDAELKAVKFENITGNEPIEKILISKGIATEQEIQQTKAEMYGMGYIELRAISIPTEVLNLIPKETANRNQVIAFEQTSSRVKVAMVDPLDLQKVKLIESLVAKRVDSYFATAQEIREVIDTRYGVQVSQEVDEALQDVSVVNLGSSNTADLSNTKVDDSASVTKIVNMILDYAVKHEASDVHIEPRENKIAVRFRIHGILMDKLSLPTTLAPQVVTRIKILSNMRIDEHRVPQDNRFQIKTDDKVVDIRVSIMPNIYGEKVVMRLLEKGTGVIPLEETGMRGSGFKLYRNALNKTQGILLITGPTGSGKTVTLASSLAILNKQEVNIVTIEDPVEIRIDGITQVQVNSQVGLTFAAGLRSFLRQDPDIIMVGEIRDKETAELAVQAALTGHLVLATLHTNSAAGALPRLLDMGIQPFLLGSTIDVVVAQRLVRKLCNECKRQVRATPEIVAMLHQTLDSLHGFDIYHGDQNQKIHFDSQTESVMLYEAVGCPKCANTGYTGRIGIFEVMPMSEKIDRLVMSSSASSEIEKVAVSEGMITMFQDGVMKAMQGLTTIEEILRVQND